MIFLYPSVTSILTDTETDTCDAVLQNIMARAALHITDEHQQRYTHYLTRKLSN